MPPLTFSCIAQPKRSNGDQSKVSRKIYIMHIFLPIQVTKIEHKLCNGDRLLEIFLTIAVSEDFRGPQNSSTTVVHCGRWQLVFKYQQSITILVWILNSSADIFNTVYPVIYVYKIQPKSMTHVPCDMHNVCRICWGYLYSSYSQVSLVLSPN